MTKTLSFGNKVLITSLIVTLIGVTFWWFFAVYKHFTVIGPAEGGQYIEAVTGQPHLINPLLAPGSSSTSDRLLTKLVYSGLYSYDNSGELKSDIAESFERSDDGKTYVVNLREDVKWHDGEDFTADDVIFTVNVAKDISYDTVVSALRVAWRDVTVEKNDDYTVTFTLDKARGDFLHLLTLGILPQHIWRDISPVQFLLAEYNTKPIGSGPYAYADRNFDAEGLVSSYTLRANSQYHHGEPLITKFVLQIYAERSLAVQAYIDGLVSGVTADTRELAESLASSQQSKVVLQRPSYFGVFFNRTRSKSLAFAEVRQALLYATDRTQIIDDVFGVSAYAVRSALFKGMKDFEESSQQPEYDTVRAIELLEEKGWKVGEDGIRVREADSERLAFSIAVNDDQDKLRETAEILAAQWAKIGAEVTVDARSKDELEANVIKTREYDSLLTFHPMRWDQPNMLALWHSREKDHPGLNYGLMQDGPTDTALDALQTESDENERNLLYDQVQSRIKIEDPAAFLFATSFLFSYKSDIKGIDLRRVNAPQDRYSNVHDWYIKERRQLK